MVETLQQIGGWILAAMGISLAIALIGLALIYQRIRRLRIPAEADFFTTLRMVPLSLAILLDLLDFGLDFLSAPVAWIVLDRLGLANLRNKAVIEALIPMTGAIPTFTISWIAARWLRLGDETLIGT